MRMLKSPISVVWEITNNCNYKCPHCRAYMKMTKDDKKVEERVIEELIKNEVLSVNISGGEPLLNSRIFDIVSKLAQNNIDVGISSNGWFFEEKAEQLVDSGITFLQVSVDGPHYLHDKFRGIEGAYERAIGALKCAKNYGIRTQMNVTITANNLDTLMYNVDLAKDLGIDRIFFRRVVPVGKGKENSFILPEKNKYLETIKSLNQIQTSYLNIAIDDPVLSIMKSEDEINMDTISCTAGIKSIGISSNGDVFPCIFLREKIGNLMNSDLRDIWHNSSILQILRERKIGQCGECQYKFVCGGCRAFSGLKELDDMCPLK